MIFEHVDSPFVCTCIEADAHSVSGFVAAHRDYGFNQEFLTLTLRRRFE